MRKPNNLFLLLIALLLIIFVVNQYNSIAILKPQESFKIYRHKLNVRNEVTDLEIPLRKDAYLLRTKHVIQENQPKYVLLNGSHASADKYSSKLKKGIIETDYFYLPKNNIKDGMNSIEIRFPQSKPKEIDVIITNYRKKVSDNIFIIFYDSIYNNVINPRYHRNVFCVIIIFFCLLFILYLFSNRHAALLNKIILWQIYSLLPLCILLALIRGILHLYKSYGIVISTSYFWRLAIISFFFTESVIIIRTFWKDITTVKNYGEILHKFHENVKQRRAYEEKTKIGAYAGVANIGKVILLSIFAWLRFVGFVNIASRFILLFIALFVICAFLLILNLDMVAEQLANVAFCALVVGIVLKFIEYIRSPKSYS